MAIDTKPNLTSNKFEQCVGDTLTLSGITNVHGTFSILSGATLTILPNRGVGKILTSDANGHATWQTGGSINGADNGLTLSGNKIILGGTLTGDTSIALGSRCLCYEDTNSYYYFKNLCSILAANTDVYINLHGDSNDGSAMSLIVNNKCVDINDCFDWVKLQNTNSCVSVGSICMCINANNSTCVDIDGFNNCILITSINAAKYAGDYSGTYTARSIPDAAWVTGRTSTSASGERITKLINQPSHGFTVGTVLGWSGGTYNKPIANGFYDGEILGIVSKCYNVNCFDLTQAGYVTGLTSLTANTTYFLSPTTAGLLTPNEPTINGCIAKTMLIADTTTSAWVLPYAGYVVTTGSSGGGTVTGAANGLTLSGSDIILGGTLTGNTAINLGNKELFISGVTTCLHLIPWNTQIELSANNNAYLSLWGVSGNENVYLQANTNSYLDINGVSGSEYVSLYASPVNYSGLDIIGSSSNQCLCLSSNINTYLYFCGVSGSEQACLQSDVNTYLRLSGGTASILGNLKLLTTPATGVCTDKVLTWNVTDNTVKILPYSSGGTGGSSLSEFTITGNSSATGFTVNHAKNKQFVGVEVVRNSSPYPTVYTDVYRTNANCVCVTFATAPTTGLQYKILITS